MVIEFNKISVQSPIWIFQANKIFDLSLIKKIEEDTINFLNSCIASLEIFVPSVLI